MKSVVLCSSRKFRNEAYAFLDKLEALGVTVFRPPLKTWTDEEWKRLSKEEKQEVITELTYGHFKKIDQADVVFLFNKDGYSGVSVSLELGYAVAKNKPIYALAEDEEYARNALYHSFATTPEELVKLL